MEEMLIIPAELFCDREAWQKDGPQCTKCDTKFNMLRRRHHCRLCGYLACDICAPEDGVLAGSATDEHVRICDACKPKVMEYYKAKAQEKEAKVARVAAALKNRQEGNTDRVAELEAVDASASQLDQRMRMQQRMQAVRVQETESKEQEMAYKAPENWKTLHIEFDPIPQCEWRPDAERDTCKACSEEFDNVNRRHHCRSCGDIFCDDCAPAIGIPRVPVFSGDGMDSELRVCETCFGSAWGKYQARKQKEHEKQQKIDAVTKEKLKGQ